MEATINNSTIVLKGVDPSMASAIAKALTYKDKAKLYELKRISRYYSSTHPKILDLKSQITGKLYEKNGDDLTFSSGFYDIIKQSGVSIIDNRTENGQKIPLPWKKQPLRLRSYQEEAVELMEENYRGLINFATGLGKTLVAVYATRRIKKKTLIICPSESIASQFYDNMCDAFGEDKVGFYGSGKKKINKITVAIAASVNNNVDIFKNEDLGLVIFDEVHHIAANTFFKISMRLANVGKMFGLTATDYRSDGKDIMITAGCGTVLIRRNIRWGVDNGWLAKPVFVIRKVNTKGHSYRNDKLKNYKEHVLNNDLMKKTIQSDIQNFLDVGKQVLCIVAEVAHGQELSKHFNALFATGIDKKSQSYVKEFNNKKVQLLIGTAGKISEGTDTKSTEVLILANFVASKGPVIQAVGRGLRLYPGKKTCIILDYIPMGSDMLARHGFQRVDYYKDITDKVKVI